ncbi:polysaccharide biosynthesis tyrosine autokinase [Oryzobacter telluris]|uniref:polysaccharide biosynthesis tyrosine autokinase n=1 Tax=Oryzobacter telluris TaxID=3149179 RepID=UPI00370D5FAC
MTILDFVRLSRAHLLHLVVLTVVGAGAALAVTSQMPAVFLADASGYVVVGGDPQSSGEGLAETTLGGSKADSYLPLVTGRAVAQRAIEETGIQASPAEVAGRVSASVAPNSVILKVMATGPTSEQARLLADAVIAATAEEANRIERVGSASAGSTPLVQIVPIETALPGVKVAPVTRTNLLVGALVGLGVAYVLVFLRRQLDTRLRSVADVEELVATSVLGVVPTTTELRRETARGRLEDLGPAAEAFRQIRTNLRYLSVDGSLRSIVVTSANPGEGKSTVSATLARTLSEAGQKTVIIDADLRRPTLAAVLDQSGRVGLSQLLSGQVRLKDVLQDTDQPNLKFIAAGRVPPNPSELLGSQRMHALVDHLAKDHLVILDAPPLLAVTDAGLLAAMTDGALLVFAVGRTQKEQARHSAKLMAQVGARVLGVVLNLAPRKGVATAIYGHGYGGYASYGSYTSTVTEVETAPADEVTPEAPVVGPGSARPSQRQRARARV